MTRLLIWPKSLWQDIAILLLRIRLHATTTLFGVSDLLTVLVPKGSAVSFSDPDTPQPLVETVDDPRMEHRDRTRSNR